MKLGWNRAEDGVITVYAHVGTGKVFPIADFWVSTWGEVDARPGREWKLQKQQELAEFFVAAWNASSRAEIMADPEDDSCPYFYNPGEEGIPETARRFVAIPPSRDEMKDGKGCWLNIAGCVGNCGSYGCGE